MPAGLIIGFTTLDSFVALLDPADDGVEVEGGGEGDGVDELVCNLSNQITFMINIQKVI
jgi:hypothetical protein